MRCNMREVEEEIWLSQGENERINDKEKSR